MVRQTNQELIYEYVEDFDTPSRIMRTSSLKYFFGEEPHFNYDKHIYDLKNIDFLKYFKWVKKCTSISIQTRKNKAVILRSFIKWIRYAKEELKGFEFPPYNMANWKNAPRKAETKNGNGKTFATAKEIEQILQHFKRNNLQSYIIVRILTETGMRIGELSKCLREDFILEQRYFHIKEGKTDEKIYPITEKFNKFMKIFLNMRDYEPKDNLFLNLRNKRMTERTIQSMLKKVRETLNIEKQITTKTFRKTINNLRKKMGCSNEDRAILLGHSIDSHSKLSSVNVENYTDDSIETHKEIYDKWFPYTNIKL